MEATGMREPDARIKQVSADPRSPVSVQAAAEHMPEMFRPVLSRDSLAEIILRPKLTWWFDHHQSAFLNAEDQEQFRRDTSGRKLYAPTYKSCTAFICRVAADRFGFHAPDLDDLVHW